MELFRYIKDFFVLHKKDYILGIFFLILVDLLQIIPPKIIGTITDSIAGGTLNLKGLIYYISIILLVSIFIAIFRYAWRVYLMGGSRKLEYWLRNKLFSHLSYMSMDFFNHKKTGDLMAHATNDVNSVKMSFGMGIVMLIDTLVLTISIIVVMFSTINPKLTVLALIPLPFLALTVLFSGKLLQKLHRSVQDSFSSMSDTVQENLSGIRIIKSFVKEINQEMIFNNKSNDYVDANIKLAKLSSLIIPLVTFFGSLSFVLALFVGSSMVINDVITIGELVTFINYLGMLTWPIMAIGWLVNMSQRGSAALKRINVLLDEKPEINDNQSIEIPNLGSTLKFNDVAFNYPESEETVLKNISFEIIPGQTLAIVGKTGCGKSTIANLVMRFYDNFEGNITIGSIPIKQIPLNTLRDHIAYVPQDNFLFSTTIKDNISFFNSGNSTMEAIEHYAKIANVHQDIIQLKDGFNTVLGERGINLSGGQKQRVSIARALIKNSPILILDDCLSAVDTKTEEAILHNLKEETKSKTCIIVAHRLSSIKHADEIIFLENGEIIERGNHNSLLESKGKYYKLYKKQLLEKQIEEE